MWPTLLHLTNIISHLYGLSVLHKHMKSVLHAAKYGMKCESIDKLLTGTEKYVFILMRIR